MKVDTDKVIDKAREEARRVLENCLHPLGVKASAKPRGYPQIWARDSMVTLLGGLLSGDNHIRRALRASIITLKKHQSPLGVIPNNVDTRTGKADFRAYADGGLWFVIGNAIFFEVTGDKKFLKGNYPAIKKALLWYEYQDGGQTGFISAGEATDWEDLLATREKGLYVNVLYHEALMKGAWLAKAVGDGAGRRSYLEKARDLKSRINRKFWFFKGRDIREIIAHNFGNEENLKKVKRPKKLLTRDSYYLPYIAFRDFGEWFDSFGNTLAVITGVADRKQTNQILKLIEKYKVAKPYPIKAIYPPISPGDKDWRYYYKHGGLNFPYQYHNGGIWPFLGGFYVAALVKAKKYGEARRVLRLLASVNKKGREGEWEFNEWFHGKSGKPLGMAEQAWSAGMYIYAHECVKRKKVLFL